MSHCKVSVSMSCTANEWLSVSRVLQSITMHYFTFHGGAQKRITFLVAVCTNLELHMFNNRAIPISIEFFNTEYQLGSLNSIFC